MLYTDEGCFYWTKIQNLKAILNKTDNYERKFEGAFTEQRYKIWKQFSTVLEIIDVGNKGAFTEQRYKIWKQFST